MATTNNISVLNDALITCKNGVITGSEIESIITQYESTLKDPNLLETGKNVGLFNGLLRIINNTLIKPLFKDSKGRKDRRFTLVAPEKTDPRRYASHQ